MAAILVGEDRGDGRGEQLQPVDVAAALRVLARDQELAEQLLRPEDHYLADDDTLLRRRSGWVRLRRALHLSTAITAAEAWKEDGDWGWDFLVRVTDPRTGRYEDGDGSCSYSELAEKYAASGGQGPAPTRHNVRATALTRAKNRGTMDLLGLPEQVPDLMDRLNVGYRSPFESGGPGEAAEVRSAQEDIVALFGDEASFGSGADGTEEPEVPEYPLEDLSEKYGEEVGMAVARYR